MGRDQEGTRLDILVAEIVPDLSRSLARKLIESGHVLVNGRLAKPSRHVVIDDRIEVDVILPPSISAEPEAIPLSIVYRDNDLVVLDKPAGLVVHPGAGHLSGTLANALMASFPAVSSVGAKDRPGIVHRLDKDTSGLMVVALSPSAHRSLQSQISSRTAERRYFALVGGSLKPPQGKIDAPIGRDPKNRKRMAVHGAGERSAQTSYEVLEYLKGSTFLEAMLHTGRTHQIRVHMQATGHPLVGDRVYRGPGLPGLNRQFLHAHCLSIDSPTTGYRLDFESPLPPDLQTVLYELRQNG